MTELKSRIPILSLWVDPVDKAGALERVSAFLTEGTRPHIIFAVNPEKCFSVPKDPFLHRAFREADLLIPDGIGVVIAARILCGVRIGRVPGVDLMLDICKIAADKGRKIFVYGSKEGVSQKACAELGKMYPNLKIVGRSHGYVTEKEMPNLVEKINHSGAEILFLALGSPKQERWFASYKDELQHVRVCQGIGGTLDTIAGNVKRAPEIWQKLSAEWLYRLLSDPKRIRRQIVLPLFAMKVVIARLASKGARRRVGRPPLQE